MRFSCQLLQIPRLSRVQCPRAQTHPPLSEKLETGESRTHFSKKMERYELVPQIDPSVPQPVFTITEKAPTRAFYWLKAPTSAFTFKTLLRHYAFNQEKALVGAFSVIVKSSGTFGSPSFQAVASTQPCTWWAWRRAWRGSGRCGRSACRSRPGRGTRCAGSCGRRSAARGHQHSDNDSNEQCNVSFISLQ